MKINPSLIALSAVLFISACDNKPEVIDREPQDPMADQLANAGEVKLPPMVQASKTFRCKDNSLIFVDYMNDGTTANLRLEKKDAAPVVLTAPEAGKPFVAEGYSVTGPGATIDATLPGKGTQSCKS
jgi:hypothetical protein